MARVLVVDDATVIVEKLKHILKFGGHDVVGEAGNGLQAYLLYQKLKPDVVTMDLTMPGVDGIEGIRKIKAYDPGACVIVVSAMSQKQMIFEALDSGADGFVLKPFEADKVLEAIEQVLSQEKAKKNAPQHDKVDDHAHLANQKAEVDAVLLQEMLRIKQKNREKEVQLSKAQLKRK